MGRAGDRTLGHLQFSDLRSSQSRYLTTRPHGHIYQSVLQHDIALGSKGSRQRIKKIGTDITQAIDPNLTLV